jgi:acylphosphatase
MSSIHRETVHFSGHVQGVGFRYAALQVAREFEVAGYVANLADGRVEVVAEGMPAEVGRFIAGVEERMHGYIRRTERRAEVGAPQHRGFVIR